MSRELWDKVTNGMDEDFAEEAAEYFARHGNDPIPEDREIDGGAPIKLSAQPVKRSPLKIAAAACAGAAAVGLAVTGGVALFGGGLSVSSGEPPASVPTDVLESQDPESAEPSEVIRSGQLTQRAFCENGVVELSDFDTPDLYSLEGQEPLFVFEGDGCRYSVFGIGGDDNTDTSVTLWKSSELDAVQLAEFDLGGTGLVIRDVELTESYIVLFYRDSSTRQSDFVLMDIATGELSRDENLSLWANEDEYEPIYDISYNGGDTISWFTRGSGIQEYSIDTGESAHARIDGLVQYGHADRACYIRSVSDSEHPAGMLTCGDSSIAIDGHVENAHLYAYENGIAVWREYSLIYFCNSETGRVYSHYVGINRDDIEVGIKCGLVYVRDESTLELFDPVNELRYQHYYDKKLIDECGAPVCLDSASPLYQRVSGMFPACEIYSVDSADGIYYVCLDEDGSADIIYRDINGYHVIAEPDGSITDNRTYLLDVSVSDNSLALMACDGTYLYYSYGGGILERIDKNGSRQEIADCRAVPYVTYKSNWAELSLDGDSGSFMSGSEQLLAVCLEFTDTDADGTVYTKQDIYGIDRDTGTVTTSSLGIYSISQTDEVRGEWPQFEPYSGGDAQLDSFATTLSDYVQQLEKKAVEEMLASEDGFTRQMALEGQLYYVVTDASRVSAGNGWFWKKSYMLNQTTHAAIHEIYYQEGGEFTLLHRIEYVEPYFACDGERVYFLVDDGIIGCVSRGGIVRQIADKRSVLPENANEDTIDEYVWLTYGTTFGGSGSRLNVKMRKAYSAGGGNTLYCEHLCVIDTTTLTVVMEHIADWTDYYGEDAEAEDAPPADESIHHPMGVEYWYSGAAGAHGHDVTVREDAPELFALGEEKLAAAAMILSVLNGTAECDMAAGYGADGAVGYPLEDNYPDYKGLIDLCADTFAPGVFFAGAVYADEIPEGFKEWLSAEQQAIYKNGSTIRQQLIHSVVQRDGRACITPHPADGKYTATELVGIWSESATEIVYQLCTFRNAGGSGTVISESSRMVLELINGEWLITEIRAELGDKVGADIGLHDGGQIYPEAEGLYNKALSEGNIAYCISRIEAEGKTVLDSEAADLDFDGIYELAVLVSNGTNAKELYIYENCGGCLLKSQILSGTPLRYISTLELTPYSGEHGKLHSFTFTYNIGAVMHAKVLGAIVYNGSGKPYSAECIVSSGTLVYADIETPFATTFFRRGWDPADIAIGVNYNDISEEEYNGILSEITGAVPYSSDTASALYSYWTERWNSISEQYDGMIQPQASVFCTKLSIDKVLVVFVYPSYKTNRCVVCLCDKNGITELAELGCGWEFEVLSDDKDTLLHITTSLSGSTIDGKTEEIGDIYYTVGSDGLSCVLNTGRYEVNGSTVQWFSYDAEYNACDLSESEYNSEMTAVTKGFEVIRQIDIDKDNDHAIDESFPFMEKDGFEEYISSAISVE